MKLLRLVNYWNATVVISGRQRCCRFNQPVGCLTNDSIDQIASLWNIVKQPNGPADIRGQNPHSSGPAAKTLMATLKQKAESAATRRAS